MLTKIIKRIFKDDSLFVFSFPLKNEVNDIVIRINGKTYHRYGFYQDTINAFLLFPWKLNGERKWLQKVKIKRQCCIDTPLCCSIPPFFYSWVPMEFTTNQIDWQI